MTFRALVCGADTLGLKYSAKGASEFAAALQRYSYDVVQPEASKSAIHLAFDEFVDSCGASDTVLLYFSGHGLMESGKLSLLTGNDPQRLSNRLILNGLLENLSSCKAKNKIVILDLCHATRAAADVTVEFSDQLVILASSHRLEKSLETDDLKSSVFTAYLQKIVENAVDLAKSSVLDLTTLREVLDAEIRGFNLHSVVQAPLPKIYGPHCNFPVLKLIDENTRGESLVSLNLEKIEREYRHLLLRNCDIVSLVNLPDDRDLAMKSLELRRLYVPLRVWVEVRKSDDVKDADWDEVEARRRLSMTHSSKTPQTGMKKRASVGSRLNKSRQLVILGDPGSGKTTLLSWIATAYLLRIQDRDAWANLPDVETLPDTDWLPIVVRCRELDLISLSGSLDDILEESLRKGETAPNAIDDLRGMLRERLAAGTAILMIDGLDEITDPVRRAAFCSQLEKIHLAHPGAAIIITSRIVGYRDMGVKLGRGFEHLTLADLATEEKNDFARRWCFLTEPPDRASAAAIALIQDVHSNDRIERMTGNPMLLTTMALVKRKVGKLPSRRADLYAEAVQVLLSWRCNVGSRIDKHEALPQLEYLAHAMCDAGVQQLSHSEVVRLLTRMRDDFPNLHHINHQSPQEFLKQLESKTGIIVEAGRVRRLGVEELIYEFRHLTFQEFLAACALVRGHFHGRNKGLSLAEETGPLAGRTSALAFTEGGEEEIAVSENWREALRLVATICHDEDLDEFLIAILNTCNRESPSTARARAILAVLCVADEPNVSHSTVSTIFWKFANQIDYRDRNVEIRTGIHVAAKAIVGTRWCDTLINILVEHFLLLPPLERDFSGDIAGLVAAHQALSAPSMLAEWWQRQSDLVQNGQVEEAVRAALSIASISITSKRVSITSQLISALIERLNGAAPMAHAAAQALANLQTYGENDAWEASTTQLNTFLQLIDDPASDPEVIRFLLQISGYSKIPQSLEKIVRWISHSNPDLRRMIITAIADYTFAETFQLVTSLAEDPDSEVRESAIIELGTRKSEEALPLLRAALNDPSDAVRGAAVWYLDTENDVDSVDALLNRLSDEAAEVRKGAIYSLSIIKSAAAVLPIIELINDEDLGVSLWAIRALGELGDERSIPALMRMLNRQNERDIIRLRSFLVEMEEGASDAMIGTLPRGDVDELLQCLIEALGKIGGKKALAAILLFIAHPKAPIRSLASRSVVQMSPSVEYETLIDMLSRGTTYQSGAIEALAHMKAENTLQLALDFLESESSAVVQSAVTALGNLGDSHAEEKLIQLDDNFFEPRFLIIQSLGLIKSLAAEERLIDLARDDDDADQYAAIEALGRISTPRANEKLRELLDAETPFVRSCAVEALSFNSPAITQKVLSENLDGRWPFIDNKKIITTSTAQVIARQMGMTTGEIQSLLESIQGNFRLCLSWNRPN